MLKLRKFQFSNRGDTIIEVLLAIGIAAFAIGVTYSTAQRSLNQSIAARERNEALNIMENQITSLKLRYNKSSSPAVFTTYFASPVNHFCLDDSAITPSTTTPWTPLFNTAVTESTPIQSPAYNPLCGRNKSGEGTTYFIDIQTSTLPGITQNPTVYQVSVRWEGNDGKHNQASAYYRVNGANGQVLGMLLPTELNQLATSGVWTYGA